MNILIDNKGENYKSKLINDSIESENPDKFVEKPRENDWYQPKIDKKILKDLSKRRSLPGIIYISLFD